MNLPKFWAQIYPMLRWVALALLIAILFQAMPFDPLAVFFAGDILAYVEVAAAVWLVAQVTRVRWAAFYARHVVKRIVRRGRARARRAVRRRAGLRPPSKTDGRPRPAAAFAFA
jgi:hypothetical protein